MSETHSTETSSSGSVLLIDDDRAFRFALRKALRRLGYEVREASSGEEALGELRSSSPPDVALLDLRMDGMDGLEVLRRRGSCPTRVVVLTGHGTVQAAVQAMQLGAFSFLEKPVDGDILGPLLAQACADDRPLGSSGPDSFAPPLIGTSRATQEIREFVARVAPTDETVAVYGETGTGKEVVARHIHLASSRADRHFVGLNAACVPENLFESELFGHTRGAFTGATSDRPGLFREADGGTVFLDEVAELPLELQAKLLRTLETRTVRAIGASKEVAIDVRIVAATNRDLWQEVQSGRFREDLYFRLQVFPIVIPPLRHRREDIVPLAEHLLTRVGSRASLTDDAKKALEVYRWPGNVREVLNVLRRASLFADGAKMDGDLVRRMIAASVFARTDVPPHREPSVVPAGGVPASGGTSKLADVERAHIENVLRDLGGNITRAAQALGIDRRTLQRKMRSYGLAGDDP
jgi:DNA-binding NtrC family response regulator